MATEKDQMEDLKYGMPQQNQSIRFRKGKGRVVVWASMYELSDGGISSLRLVGNIPLPSNKNTLTMEQIYDNKKYFSDSPINYFSNKTI